jgi:hypothetical protein
MAATDRIDPVSEPDAYRQSLFGLLGDQDPAQVQAATPARLRALVAEAGTDLRTRPEPGEWSVLELIGHIADAEIVSAGRYRWILAHDAPEIMPYDQDLWAERLRHNEIEPDELLVPFEALRAADIALWERTPVAEQARYGLHRERGRETYEMTFRLIAGHDLFHIDQAQSTLAGIRSRRHGA